METLDVTGAMEGNQRKIKKEKGRVILKILESQEGDFGILDNLYPVGTWLVFYDSTLQCTVVMMEVYFTGSNIDQGA